jgi:hypothetical protein
MTQAHREDPSERIFEAGPKPYPVPGAPKAVLRPEKRRRSLGNFGAGQVPRLDQFPSAQPRSEQESLLLEYVRQTPREEVMVAAGQARITDDLRIKVLKIAPLRPEPSPLDSSERN